MTRRIFRVRNRMGYLIVERAAVEDERLSWAARGLLVDLLAKPDNWQVIVNDLVKRGDLGRDGIYGLLQELKIADYVRYEKHRDPGGRLRGGDYRVFERPPGSEPPPLPESPDTVQPEPVPPDSGQARSIIEARSTLSKYDTVLAVCGYQKMDPSRDPYQSASALIKLRNALVHFKPEWDDEVKEHLALEKRLKGRFPDSRLTARIAGRMQWFPGKCLGTVAALWAVSTAQDFSKEFCNRLKIRERLSE